MDPQTAAAVISGSVALALGLVAAVATKNRPGLSNDAPKPPPPVSAPAEAVVQKLAQDGIDGLTPQEVGFAVSALAQTITAQGGRISRLEHRGWTYQRRIAVLEQFATYSPDPPPRKLPPWPDEPTPESS